EVSGAPMTRYDTTTPQLWKVPLRDVVLPHTVVDAPRGGYIVPAGFAGIVAAKLDQHGIRHRRIECPATLSCEALDVQAFRADAKRFAAQPTEGRQRLAIDGQWKAETRAVAEGSLFVPIAQPKARLVMALLEPRAPDSLLQWGVFNNAFESKEYMEAYVAEAVAREMLAADPELKLAFERRLREDGSFARDPSARLQFFHRRHPSWDERLDLYPVLRVDQVLD